MFRVISEFLEAHWMKRSQVAVENVNVPEDCFVSILIVSLRDAILKCSLFPSLPICLLVLIFNVCFLYFLFKLVDITILYKHVLGFLRLLILLFFLICFFLSIFHETLSCIVSSNSHCPHLIM